jgi:hypothetical protein
MGGGEERENRHVDRGVCADPIDWILVHGGEYTWCTLQCKVKVLGASLAKSPG